MARQVVRGKPVAPTNGVINGAESVAATHQDRVFVITPRPPVKRVGGGVALDLPSIDAIRAGASGADPDEVMADVLNVIKEVREEDHRAQKAQ